jgi:hypothetical protein
MGRSTTLRWSPDRVQRRSLSGRWWSSAGELSKAFDAQTPFILAIWFFLSFIGPELKLPEATLRLSVFYYYGTPLVHGLQVANMLGIVVVGVVVLAIGVLRFARKDIAV